ncbi:transcription factor Tfb2, partial [Nadsonia fulvescens var. elongata DSM 6958]
MCMSLDTEFRRSFKAALTGEAVESNHEDNSNHNTSNNTGNHGEDMEDSSFGVPLNTPDKHPVDIKFLDDHATRQWELILHFMVGTPLSQMPNPGVLSLLQHAKLMETTPGDGVMRITNAGFQFLLQDVNAQIWTLLLQYLSMSEGLNMNTVDVLNFIFMLGSLELGRDYSLAALSDTQLTMLEDLRDFGLVYQRKRSSRRFYPTRLATTLTSDASSLRTPSKAMEVATSDKKDSDKNNRGTVTPSSTTTSTTSKFIILETNYRLYAYTDSPLQIAVLNLFVSLKTRFANMVTGQITRDSVRFALSNGITATQILTYLTVHAHPQMYKGDKGVLPPTVVDQIKLWQLEMDRVNAMPGYLYTDFRHNDEYAMVVGYAREL